MSTETTKEERGHLEDLLIGYVAKGGQPKAVIEYLFRVYGKQERVCAQDITDNGGPKGDGSVAAVVSRLRDQISDFFDYRPEGRNERWRVVLPKDDPGNYALQFTRNAPPTDLVPNFWHHHFSRDNALILYPELSIFTPATSQQALVPASSVRSILRLIDCFRKWNVRITATAIRPYLTIPDEDRVVLATPATMPNLEVPGPMQVVADGVTVEEEIKGKLRTSRYDETREADATGSTGLQRWAVLTRHHYRFHRTITVIAAPTEIAVEAVVAFLTREEPMLMLAEVMRSKQSFPDHFQVLFSIRLIKGDNYPRDIRIQQVLDVGGMSKTPPLS